MPGRRADRGKKVPAKKTAILGGSFDPVHNGHLALARSAREAFGLEQVVFMPAACSHLKKTARMFGDAERLVLLEAAIRGEAGLSLSRLEIERGAPSWTIETALALGASEGDPVFWIIGADCAATLERWHRAADLARLVHFYAAEREGQPLVACPGFTVIPFVCPRVDVSSTMVRQRLRDGLPVDGLVPPAVADLITARSAECARAQRAGQG